MKLKDLLIKGHFPPELPPPFTTKYFGDYYLKAKTKPVVSKSSRGIKYSIPRLGLARKIVTITNPQHQTPLSEFICDNWPKIQIHFKKSKISSSKPGLNGDRAASLKNFKNYKRKCFETSFFHRVELKSDISKYFHSIYTHSISWAIHTKPVSKKNAASRTWDWGDKLDALLRNTQYNQTVGIPFGPDTSHIISELLGSVIDEHIQKIHPGIVGHRFVDDMHFYFNDQAEAELCVKEIQYILRDYELQINNDKTKISPLPISIEEEWVITLRKFDFNTTQQQQYHDLFTYFSLAFDFAGRFPDKFVLKYAIRRLQEEYIYSQNYKTFEAMLLKAVMAESAVLPSVLQILLAYKKKVDKGRVKLTIQNILRYACPRGFDYEVSWALWYAHTFKIKLDDEIGKHLENIVCPASILIALDLMEQKLINRKSVKIKKWQTQINKDSLTDEKWLLAYEIAVKNWLLPKFDYLDKEPDNKYYQALKKNKVSFYNNKLQVKIPAVYKEKKGDKKGSEKTVSKRKMSLLFDFDFDY